jgi:hypothetical protein
MRSRRDVDSGPRRRDGFLDDEEDDLPVPAGALRVVLGLVGMTSGFLVSALWEGGWPAWAGLALFILSPFVMLKSPEK